MSNLREAVLARVPDPDPTPPTDGFGGTPYVGVVRPVSDVHADMIEASESEGDDGLKVTLLGQEFTARKHRPAGAFAVCCARLKSSNTAVQLSAPIKLLEAWLVIEDADRLYEALEQVDDFDKWLTTEFAGVLEALTARPTSAP